MFNASESRPSGFDAPMKAPIPATPIQALTRDASPAEKIACFRALFRGRSDVYPQRFESRKTGRAGYSPACGNEWERGLCEKPRIKCSDCPNQNWLPVQDWTIRWHLSGQDSDGKPFVMGLCPMLLDETCFFLAIDLDGAGWEADAKALASVVRRLDLPLVLERSRSGNGAHLWFFFKDAIPATLARKFGAHLLTEAMDLRPEVGLASYDRLFPNQDTLPKGGFGNLIALPLQKTAREQQNSVFLNEDFEPHADQWAFLAGVRKITQETVRQHVRKAEHSNRILPVAGPPSDAFAAAPWEAPPSRRPPADPISGALPEKIELTLSDQIYIPKANLPPALRNRILQLAAFQNPEFYKAQAMRLPTYDKPRVIACAEEHPKHIALPRGCQEALHSLLRQHKIRRTTKDLRQQGTPVDVKFHGNLRPEQQVAAGAMLRHDTGVLAATTAFGKTVLAAWLIVERGVNTLILVHRRQLMDQWVERLAAFLNIPEKSIGRLGGGRRKLKGSIDIALMQSLVRKGEVDDRIADYGHLIVDECHHLSAHSFELAAKRAKAKYVLGLSATVQRKDGHHPIIFMQCGPVRHRVDAKTQAVARPFTHSVIVRPTDFESPFPEADDARVEFQQLSQALAEDSQRNRMIRDDVLRNLEGGRHPLLLTERTSHLKALDQLFKEAGVETIILRGGLPKRELAASMEALSVERRAVILATGRFIGEGFDCPWLDTLFITLPVSWHGTIAQYAGRLHRLHEGKLEVRIFDYADLNLPMLSRMFDKRCAGYEAVGYSILLPASALPGWPQSVPLPVDPAWKRDYAASVKRLIRDGVETPLAELFMQTTKPSTDAPGARSASEAFFYKRLETLEKTRGQFVLNHELPIPFNQRGTMEVDFLCEPLKLVVELDGSQHLEDEAAWRSDREKDALLQRHGYFILRFLANDLSRNLDHVMDSLHGTMAFLRRRAGIKQSSQ